MLMLASASVARHQLLEKAGIPHLVMPSGLEEEGFHRSDALKMAANLALAKANAVANKLVCEDLDCNAYNKINSVLGCDSLFVFQDEIWGKPRDSEEAFERWARISSKSGFLITGHALLFSTSIGDREREIGLVLNRSIQHVVSTRVEFEELTSQEIEQYVSTGEPLKCAGGFTLEGKGSIFIRGIDGCYSNVIGLSLPWLKKALVIAGIE